MRAVGQKRRKHPLHRHAFSPAFLVVLVVILAGCSNSSASSNTSHPPSGTAPPTETTGPTTLTTQQREAEATVRHFVDVVNRGDVTAVANTFAVNARFDSVGRLYQGRDQIMNRFLIPEFINLGGHYDILRVHHDPDAVTFEFHFTTRGGGSEHFTYRCIVRDRQIQDAVGRYV